MDREERGPTPERETRPLRAMGPRNEFAEAARPMSDAEIIEEIFTYHPPNIEQQGAYAAIRAAAKSLALTIMAACPPCADRTAAIRQVREAVMTANASIALRGLV